MRQSSTFICWCVSKYLLFSNISDGTYYLVDRTGSLSSHSGSGRFILQVARGVPRSAREKNTSTPQFYFFSPNLFTVWVRDLTIFRMDKRRGFCADPIPFTRCIAGSQANTIISLFLFSSSDVFIALRYVVLISVPQPPDTILSQDIRRNFPKQVCCDVLRDHGVGEISPVTRSMFSPACGVHGPPPDPDRRLQSMPDRCTL